MLRPFLRQVTTYIYGHAIKPGRKGTRLVESIDVFVKPKKYFLARITGILEISQQSPGRAEDLGLEPANQCIESMSAACFGI